MNPTFKITMENGAVMEGELYPEIAPQSVYNFIDLCNHKFYDGLIFHRVIEGFMIQGGCPRGDGTGGPDEKIKGEFLANGVPNDLKHTRGVLSMARAAHPDSAGSQFFIMHKDAPHLDGQYAAFGKVISGIAQRAVKHDKPVIAICGSRGEGAERIMELGVSEFYFSSTTAKPFSEIIKTCREDLYNVSCRAANEILEIM